MFIGISYQRRINSSAKYSNLVRLESRVDSLEEQYKDLNASSKDSVGSTSGENFQKRLTLINEKLKKLDQQLASISQTVSILEKRTKEIENNNKSLETRVDSIKGDYEALKSRIDSLVKKINNAK
ncbi:MAG: hypothetical protein ABEJ25_07545 [Candidatus Bipolaricaulia bacterium]